MADDVRKQIEALPHARLLNAVGAAAEAAGIEAYAVGGVVRDALLGRPTTDIDFVTVGAGTGIALAEAVGTALGGKAVHVYPNFGTAAVRLERGPEGGDVVLEFVAARKESYRHESRNPDIEAGALLDDLARRDFTINAIAVDVRPRTLGAIVDPFDGRGDLRKRLLRTPLEPAATFADDPLRMIRAARFAAQLEFEIEEQTLEAVEAQAPRVKILSQERITEEIQKILVTSRPSIGFSILQQHDVLPRIFPELSQLEGVEAIDGHRHKDNFYHTLQVLDNVAEATAERPCEDTVWLRWGALLHDIAKPLTKRFVEETGWTFHGHEDRGARMVPRIFRRMKLPTDERMKYVQELVRLHHRPVALVDEKVTDSAVRRLLFDAGDMIDDLMVLVRADITSKNPRRVRRYLNAFDRVEKKMAEVEEKDRLRNFQPPIDGNEIMQMLGLRPGPEVGVLKTAVREAVLEGEIPNEHDAALAYLLRIKDDLLRRSSRRRQEA